MSDSYYEFWANVAGKAIVRPAARWNNALPALNTGCHWAMSLQEWVRGGNVPASYPEIRFFV
jgi:hypothetical protein